MIKNMQLIVTTILLLLSTFHIVNAKDYVMPNDSSYYLPVNKDEALGENTYEKTRYMIERQYQGDLKLDSQKPEYGIHDYDFVFDIGIAYNILQAKAWSYQTIDSIHTPKPRNKEEFFAAIGLAWRAGYKFEYQFSQTNRSLKQISDDVRVLSRDDLKISTHFLNITKDIYYYESNFTPYFGFGLGGIVVKNKHKTENMKPVLQGILGLGYYVHKDAQAFLQYKYVHSFKKLKTRREYTLGGLIYPENTQFKFSSHSIGLGFRFFIR